MTIQAEGATAPLAEALALTPAEQASIEAGQRGLSEPTGVNEIKPTGPERPEHVPEKFWKDGKVDVEAMARSYGELERMRSAPKEEAPAAAAPGAKVDANGKIEKAEEATAAEAAPNPLSTAITAVQAEFGEKGEVSEESVASLEAAGIPKEILGTYLKGLELITKEAMGAIHSFTDGEQNYTAMAAWAAQKLSDAELEAYNTALDNPEMRENAVRGLYARFTTARPSEGSLVTPSGAASSAGDVYSDRSQLTTDQKDPRYASDPAFRQGVMDKLARSQRGGFQVVARPMFERRVLSN